MGDGRAAILVSAGENRGEAGRDWGGVRAGRSVIDNLGRGSVMCQVWATV